MIKTVAIGATMLGLGALAGVVVNNGHDNVSTAQQRPPVEIRTQVIRRTVRIHRRAKPPQQPPARLAPPASSVAAPPPRRIIVPHVVATAPVVAAPRTPIRTRTSGATGGGRGGERDHEGGHDD